MGNKNEKKIKKLRKEGFEIKFYKIKLRILKIS